jgi:nitrate reductase cytochrome c-type subunit
MKRVLRCCVVACCAALLSLPIVAGAEETNNYEKDAQGAEGTPPQIPHSIKDTSDGEYCLGCHRTGLKGAPETPHPERLYCTGCHVPGEINDLKHGKKDKHKI